MILWRCLIRAIKAGNKEDILDIGRRFPLFANLAAQVNEAGVELLDCVPEYCSARKIESVLKGDIQEAADDDREEEEAPAEKKAPAKKAITAEAEGKAKIAEAKAAQEVQKMTGITNAKKGT